MSLIATRCSVWILVNPPMLKPSPGAVMSAARTQVVHYMLYAIAYVTNKGGLLLLSLLHYYLAVAVTHLMII